MRAGTPFLYHVEKIKDRICADQYVDLASLTDANMGDETTVSGYVPVGGGGVLQTYIKA